MFKTSPLWLISMASCLRICTVQRNAPFPVLMVQLVVLVVLGAASSEMYL